MFLDDLLNGSRKQLAAPFADVVVFARDWGFRLDQVKVPVRWWHGDRDHIVPFAHGEHVVADCPTPSCITHARRESPRRPRLRRGDSAHDGRNLGPRRQEVIEGHVRTFTRPGRDDHNGASSLTDRRRPRRTKTATFRRPAELVHCGPAGLDDGRLRLLRRGAGVRRHRQDLPPLQNRSRVPHHGHPDHAAGRGVAVRAVGRPGGSAHYR